MSAREAPGLAAKKSRRELVVFKLLPDLLLAFSSLLLSILPAFHQISVRQALLRSLCKAAKILVEAEVLAAVLLEEAAGGRIVVVILHWGAQLQAAGHNAVAVGLRNL
eukprot:CAMPEP_0181405976 /NCGR_PEP_ID=MMETSP1110-20121109/5035_1 /TAXON_ID=174948 /ORGANISM="Symbiodinium sp., Strain CCMP421" /LENGTH=107 /DNA_ID=CAMNT_0023528377 /DNA_START=233 /DNA_END=555 /DNA_ORIENTATION=+